MWESFIFAATALGFGGMFFSMGFFTGASYIVRVREDASRQAPQQASEGEKK